MARSHLSPDGGSVTRPAVHRLAADGYDSTADDSPSPDVATCQAVATCRQTVEALLAPPSTAWQRMATIRAVHRLVADGYDSSSQPILFVRNPSPTNQTTLKTAIIRATVYIFSNPSKSRNPILLDLQESVRRNHNKMRCC